MQVNMNDPESIRNLVAAKYPKLDPKRIERAMNLVSKHNVLPSRYNEMGQAIPVDEIHYAVHSEGQNVWYYVNLQTKTCTCPDSAKGNVCKHRIAVYIQYKLFPELTTLMVKQTAGRAAIPVTIPQQVSV